MLGFKYIALALCLTPVLTMAVPADVQGLDANAVNQCMRDGVSLASPVLNAYSPEGSRV